MNRVTTRSLVESAESQRIDRLAELVGNDLGPDNRNCKRGVRTQVSNEINSIMLVLYDRGRDAEVEDSILKFPANWRPFIACHYATVVVAEESWPAGESVINSNPITRRRLAKYRASLPQGIQGELSAEVAVKWASRQPRDNDGRLNAGGDPENDPTMTHAGKWVAEHGSGALWCANMGGIGFVAMFAAPVAFVNRVATLSYQRRTYPQFMLDEGHGHWTPGEPLLLLNRPETDADAAGVMPAAEHPNFHKLIDLPANDEQLTAVLTAYEQVHAVGLFDAAINAGVDVGGFVDDAYDSDDDLDDDDLDDED